MKKEEKGVKEKEIIKEKKKEKLLKEVEKFGFRRARNFGQRASDKLSAWAGSWTFIILFVVFVIAWMVFNTYYWVKYQQGEPFDPYPFILLNVVLSCLAALQAPVILMSQNRQAQRDRIKAEYDYQVNKKAEREIREVKNLLMRHYRKKK